MTTTFAGYDAATRMRDTIRDIVNEELVKKKINWRYGRVVRVNRTALTADVLLLGDENPIRVQMVKTVQPLSTNELPILPETSGAVVRVEGSTNDLWITEIVSGKIYTEPIGDLTVVRLRVTAENDAHLSSTLHGLQIGSMSGFNLVVDNNEIVARNNGAAATLGLNYVGPVSISGAAFTTTVNSTLRLPNTGDAFPSSTTHAFQIGIDSDINLIADNNEIICRSNGAVSPLSINNFVLTIYTNTTDGVGIGNLRLNANQLWMTSGDLFAQFSGAGNFRMCDGGGIVQARGLLQAFAQAEVINPNTTGSAANVRYIDFGSGRRRLCLSTSSRRYKRDIADAEIDVDAVLALRPRSFHRVDDYNAKGDILPVTEDSPRHLGFVAEEAEEAGLEPWVTRNFEDKVESFAYDQFVVAHQAVLQQQQKRIETLEEKLSSLHVRLTALEAVE